MHRGAGGAEYIAAVQEAEQLSVPLSRLCEAVPSAAGQWGRGGSPNPPGEAAPGKRRQPPRVFPAGRSPRNLQGFVVPSRGWIAGESRGGFGFQFQGLGYFESLKSEATSSEDGENVVSMKFSLSPKQKKLLFF